MMVKKLAAAAAAALVTPATVPNVPFKMRRLDHIVLRCDDAQQMLNFYVGVLGAEPTTLPNGDSSVGRFGGTLTHLRLGESLIDLVSYTLNESMGRKLHAGGIGLSDDDPLPKLDVERGTLDHFAVNVEPYDPAVVRQYLEEKGFPSYSEGMRYGADGNGYSMYLRDPENNVVELKCGTPLSSSESELESSESPGDIESSSSKR